MARFNGTSGSDLSYSSINDTNGTGFDELYGFGGNDILQGYGGADFLYGGDGDDIMYGGTRTTRFIVDGNDNLYGEAGNDYIEGNQGDDYISGGVGEDSLFGGIGNDSIYGDEGNDTLYGGDYFTYEDGNDDLYGGEGNDSFVPGSGINYVDGGVGEDTLFFNLGDLAVSVELSRNSAVAQGGVEHTIYNIENVYGSNSADIISGDYLNNQISGRGGNDTLDGNFGIDTAIFFGNMNRYTISRSNGYVVVTDNREYYEIDADSGHNKVSDGTDYLINFEFLKFKDNTYNIYTIIYGSTESNNILYGDDFSDTIDGLGGNDRIFGLGGDDVLEGGAGDDWIDGGFGFDVISGGSGVDATSYAFYSGSVRANLTTGIVAFPGDGPGIDQLFSIENIFTGVGDDIVVGDAGDNVIATSDGDDRLAGGAGADRLGGGAGNDFLNGGLGIDRLQGGLGNDIYVVDHVRDLAVEAANAGIDLVRSSVTYVLGANVENLTLFGSNAINGLGNGLGNVMAGNRSANRLDGQGGHDRLFGDAGADTLVGAAGNDYLNGGLGVDTLIGGLGNDTYVVDHAMDIAIEAANAGIDRVLSSVTHVLGADFENLTLFGTAAINGVGNALANVLIGNGAANRLSGGAGADILRGGLGADTFVFASAAGARLDRIVDFTRGEDRIGLSSFDADTTRAGRQDFDFIGASRLSGDAGELRFAQGLLSGDLDGDGRADFTVALNGVAALSRADFIF